jgi:hypothetical protein
VQYLLVVDALNFCFWPDGELEYEHLAGGIKVGDNCDSADVLEIYVSSSSSAAGLVGARVLIVV